MHGPFWLEAMGCLVEASIADIERHAGTLAKMQVHSDTTHVFVQLCPALLCRQVLANRSKEHFYFIASFVGKDFVTLFCSL